MSELKSFIVLYDGKFIRAYKESEADKVIAELKSDIADLRDDKKLTDAILDERNAEIVELKKACNDEDDWCLHTLKENRHQKYKRCLVMARWCKAEQDAAFLRYNWDTGRYDDVDFYEKWHKRWLKIAEEPTWAKFLQLIHKEVK